MKTRSIGVLGAASAATVASMFVASGASADFLGWTSTRRAVTGGFLVNVFAVTDNATDRILNVSGGSPGLPTAGFITTNSTGGFKQGSITAQSVFAPSGNQSWTTLDSFLTIGGSGPSTSSTNWTGNGSVASDPPWTVTYFDTDLGSDVNIDAFKNPSNESGFINPYTSIVPATGGWYITDGTTSTFAVARSLATIAGIRMSFASVGGVNYNSSSLAASNASLGFMVAQLFVAENNVEKFIDWKMSATLRRTDGTTSNASFQMRIGDIPAPGALALLGLAGVASRRRRA